MFEIELFICIKMNLALNNLVWLIYHKTKPYLVSWGCRIHWLHLCKGVPPPKKKCPGYETIHFDGEVSVMLELWGMWSKPSLPLLPGPLWPGMVAPDRAISMGQIELNCILMLNWIVWNTTVFYIRTVLRYTELFKIELFWHLTVCKQKLYLY